MRIPARPYPNVYMYNVNPFTGGGPSVLIWIKVGQGPTALAVGAGRGCLNIFLSSIISLFFPLSLGDGLI